MNILVVGFGHFAGVLQACLGSHGHCVSQVDEEPHLLRAGQPLASSEPGYSLSSSLMGEPIDLVWIAYDCPLDGQGLPVTDEIVARIVRCHERFRKDVPFLVSCQWPVGTFAKVEALSPGRRFFYVMENVRVGHAIADFQQQVHIVGARADKTWDFSPLLPRFIVMSPESAEMTKHTTNAFMALQIAFINEIAALSEQVGANPEDVSLGLLSDWRVNPNAPLKPGSPFGGGSLLRDVKVLERLMNSDWLSEPFPILWAIRKSNDARMVKA